MPELPEVEVVRAGLHNAVAGATVSRVEVIEPRSVRRHTEAAHDFAARLTGATLEAAVRRGKFLWFPVRADEAPTTALIAHLGMSGQLLLRDHDAADRHLLRIRLDLTHPERDDIQLAFVDQRIFGSMAIDPLEPTPDGEAAGFSGPDLLSVATLHQSELDAAEPWSHSVPHQVAHVARDPLDPAFDASSFISRLLSRRCMLKRALLDQTLISGIGNIYADEALWAANLHFERPANTLSQRRAFLLLTQIRGVLLDALAQGGTSFDRQYVNVNGQGGYFQQALHAYGRAGKPCDRCGTPIERETFMNRSSYYCPRCQDRRS